MSAVRRGVGTNLSGGRKKRNYELKRNACAPGERQYVKFMKYDLKQIAENIRLGPYRRQAVWEGGKTRGKSSSKCQKKGGDRHAKNGDNPMNGNNYGRKRRDEKEKSRPNEGCGEKKKSTTGKPSILREELEKAHEVEEENPDKSTENTKLGEKKSFIRKKKWARYCHRKKRVKREGKCAHFGKKDAHDGLKSTLREKRRPKLEFFMGG